ncbi:protein kinase [Devosia sp. 1635]|uniref:protein kinase domain-containing protein n=1 Tax=Devosia sp. 1635 TaxID=2726066 RepID=UPI001566DA62
MKAISDTPGGNGAPDRKGDWLVEGRIDAGGNADVFRVRHGINGQVAALKLLRNMGAESYARFRNEVTALGKLGQLHGIVPMIDHSFPDGGERPWYVMPLARGIDDWLDGKDSKAIVEGFIHLGETLAELHSLGMAHRDIKPQNILELDGRLCFSDFGLVKYPGLSPVTPQRRDVGAKFTMAPEMRRQAGAADGLRADVFSFAKTLWICLTQEVLGFDGPYIATSNVGLSKYLPDMYTTVLDDLIADCTQHDPSARPSISAVVAGLREWLLIIGDFFLRNHREWREFADRFFPISTPSEAVWTDPGSIVSVLDQIAKVPSLNHMFLPNGGGFALKGARMAAEPGLIELDVDLTILLKPLKVTFVSFGLDTKWDYLRLEADRIEPTGHYPVDENDLHEYLSELGPGRYGHPDVWEYARETDRVLPPGSRGVTRYLRGSFVFFSTASPYNQDTTTYDARHHAMSEAEFRQYIGRNATRSAAKASREFSG